MVATVTVCHSPPLSSLCLHWEDCCRKCMPRISYVGFGTFVLWSSTLPWHFWALAILLMSAAYILTKDSSPSIGVPGESCFLNLASHLSSLLFQSYFIVYVVFSSRVSTITKSSNIWSSHVFIVWILGLVYPKP